MTIYYEDDNIIVCEKPYGVSSQKSEKENMIDIIGSETGFAVFPVNRLDVTTTGVIVYAKNRESASFLSDQLAEHGFSKEYLVVCHNIIDDRGEMRDFLFHDRKSNKTYVADRDRKGVKEAILSYEKIKEDRENALSLVKVELKTGRTHQIRAQFSSRGFVLYGDGKYGAKDNKNIALHCRKIRFILPKSGREVSFVSNPTAEIFKRFDSINV